MDCDGFLATPPTERLRPEKYSALQITAMDCELMRTAFGIVPSVTYGMLPPRAHR